MNSKEPAHENNGEQDSSSISELIFEEIRSKQASGEEINSEYYYTKYPDLRDDFKKLFDRLEQERINNQKQSSHSSEMPHTIGDYVIIREIGRGGMGIVYEAKQISLNRNVALKVLPSNLSLSKDAIAKFHREAEAMGKLKHSGLVAVYAVGEQDGTHYIAQELVDGSTSLADNLTELKKDDEQPLGYFHQAAKLVARTAEALFHAHEAGVIHRDIKPSNIMLTKELDPKVTDFGLAKVEGALALSQTGDLSGTFYYMSPEQAASKRTGIDRRTDIFSLGVTLYEMITFKRPFQGESYKEVLHEILFVEPMAPHKLNSRAPRDLSVITMKAMQKNPNKRFQNMKEFADELNRFKNGESIETLPDGAVTKVAKKIKSYPVLSAISITLLAAMIFLVTIVPWIVAQNEKKHKEEILSLSDDKRLSLIRLDAEQLWSTSPDGVEAMKEWLDRAKELHGNKNHYIERLQKLREDCREHELPYTEEIKKRDRENHPRSRDYHQLKQEKEKVKDAIKLIDYKIVNSKPSNEELTTMKSQKKEYASAIAKIDTEMSSLAEMIKVRQTWEYDDADIQWQHDILMNLINGIDDLFRKDVGLVSSIEKRILFASNIEENTILKFKDAWDQAIASISNSKESPQYKGLKIEPQIGLIPIGCDPDTGLYEFAFYEENIDLPERGKDDKKLRVWEGSPIVFVLLPGGSFLMGSDQPDGTKDNEDLNSYMETASDERPVHKVTISPFFISKYELSIRQWEWMSNNFQSYYKIGQVYDGKIHTKFCPVEGVTWNECSTFLRRQGMRLPTEAEWEYAARAGTNTIWFTGNDVLSLQGYANIADNSVPEYRKWRVEEKLNDGYTLAASVDSFKPNGFGLHNVYGNVWEWCQDGYKDNYLGAPTDGKAVSDLIIWHCVCRGGGYSSLATHSRSAFRNHQEPGYKAPEFGCRPAISLK